MSEVIKRALFLLVFSPLVLSCRSSGRDITVSEQFELCARLPAGVLHTPTRPGATDFEVTELWLGSTRGTIYVGDFPDFPGFNPALEYQEGAGVVHYIGEAEEAGIRSYLYRVGLASRQSVHVLVQIPIADVGFDKAWAQNAGMRIATCN